MSEKRFDVIRATGGSRLALGFAALVVVVLATVPLWTDQSTPRTLVTLLTLIAISQMWNLLGGYAGLVSVGQQGYLGIGAYGLWLFADRLGVHPFLAVALAAVLAGLISIPTAGLVFRLHGGYFAIGTWVTAEVFRLIVANVRQTGGGSGVTITSVAQMETGTRMMGTYWLALLVAVGTVVAVYLLLRSRLGLALMAIRDNEPAVESLGINVFRAKLWAYIISAVGMGAAGAVIYLNLLRVQPSAAFSINWTAIMIFAVVIGGMGTIEGPIIGALIFFTLQETMAQYGSWYLITLGVIAVVVTVWFPGGIWGTLTKRWPISLFPVRRILRMSGRPGPGAAPLGEPQESVE
ncbi:MAG: branched-chain amino acid ABC transporter permease [Thermoleophilia bacterium]